VTEGAGDCNDYSNQRRVVILIAMAQKKAGDRDVTALASEACVFLIFQVQCGIDPTYFAFRWITLLFSQEFLLPG